jgi:hypothetical protein
MEDIRQRMIEDMKLRGLTPCNQATYLEAVKVLARHYNRRLDEITQEQVRAFLLYLIDSKGYAKSTYKVYLSAIKFLYLNTLDRQWCFLPMIRVNPERKLPIVLSRQRRGFHPAFSTACVAGRCSQGALLWPVESLESQEVVRVTTDLESIRK